MYICQKLAKKMVGSRVIANTKGVVFWTTVYIRLPDFSYHGLFVPWTFRTVLGLFVPWTFRTLDFSYPCWTFRTFRTVDFSYRRWTFRAVFIPCPSTNCAFRRTDVCLCLSKSVMVSTQSVKVAGKHQRKGQTTAKCR